MKLSQIILLQRCLLFLLPIIFVFGCQNEAWWSLSIDDSCEPTSHLKTSDSWKQSFGSNAQMAHGCLQINWGSTAAESWVGVVKIGVSGQIQIYDKILGKFLTITDFV